MSALALGLAAAAGGLPHVDCSGVLLLTAPRDTDPHDRLGLGIAAMERVPAFLPFAPRRAPGVERALAWAATNRDAILAGLASLTGRAEMVVELEDMPQPPLPAALTGRDWLRARAQRTRRTRILIEELEQLLPPGLPRRVAPAEGGRAEAALLLPAGDMAPLARRLAAAVPGGMVLRASGPWPAFAHAADFLKPDGDAA